MNIILASASPRRRELMKLITDDFTAVSVDIDESIPQNADIRSFSVTLAEKKAKTASVKYPDCIVIGCDTTVICDGKILGKPHDRNNAREFMHMLSGCTHLVKTGCCIMYNDKMTSFSVDTYVTFRNLTDNDIEHYISTDEPYDKAGGYGIQGKGALLIKKINGDYLNVVGLPVSELNQQLKKFIKEI